MIEATEVRESLENREASRVIVPVGSLDFSVVYDSEGMGFQFLHEDDHYTLTPSGLRQLTDMFKIHYGSFATLYPDEQETLLKMRMDRYRVDGRDIIGLSNDPNDLCPVDRLTLATRTGEAVALFDGNKPYVPTNRVFSEIEDFITARGEDPEAMQIVNYHPENDAVTLDFTSPNISIDPPRKVGDTSWGGISITHNDVGTGVTDFSSFVYRLVCTNGMTVPERIRLSRLSMDKHGDDAVDRYLDTVRDAASRVWDGIPSRLGDFVSLSNVAIGEHMERIVDEINGVGREARDMILRAYQEESHEGTWYGLVNAITHVAQDPEMPWDRARLLMHRAGSITMQRAERCNTCGAKVRLRNPRRNLSAN